MIAIGNGTSVGGGTELTPDADPEDGMLDVMVSFATGPLERLAYVWQLRSGEHDERDDVITMRAKQVTVSGEDFFLAADGEISGPERRRSWHLERGRLLDGRAALRWLTERRRASRSPRRSRPPRRPRHGSPCPSPPAGRPRRRSSRRRAVSSAPLETFSGVEHQREHDRDHEVEGERGHRDVAHLVEPRDQRQRATEVLPVTGLITL